MKRLSLSLKLYTVYIIMKFKLKMKGRGERYGTKNSIRYIRYIIMYTVIYLCKKSLLFQIRGVCVVL